MRPRRHHLKSRNGCAQCKQRRVKCDEQRPCCSRCASRQTTCDYLRTKLPILQNGTVSDGIYIQEFSAATRTSVGGRGESIPSSQMRIGVPDFAPRTCDPELSSPTLQREEIQLLVQWFTSTIYTVAYSEESLQNLQRVVSPLITSHDSVMNGILALSALQLSETTTEADTRIYRNLAATYHGHGFNRNRPELHSDCCTIELSNLISISAFAFSRPSPITHAFETIDALIDIFTVIRNHSPQARTYCGDSDLVRKQIEPQALSVEEEKAFQRLKSVKAGMSPYAVSQEKDVHYLAIEALRVSFQKSRSAPRNPLWVIDWAEAVTEEFLRSMKSHNTSALIIVAHYAVLLHMFADIWWLRNWSGGLLLSIWKIVDPVYRESLLWPMSVIGLDGSEQCTQSSHGK